MLGKLMKYEIRSMGRIFLGLYAAVLAFAVVNRVFYTLQWEIPMVLASMAMVLLIFASIVTTVILIVYRFYKNLLSDEGYLMFTLPVKLDALLLSKLFTAFLFIFLSIVVAAAALFVSFGALPEDFWQELGRIISTFTNARGISGGRLASYIVAIVLFLLLNMFTFSLEAYTCMAIGQLSNRNKVAMAFVAYIVISMALQILSIFVAIALAMMGEAGMLDWLATPNLIYALPLLPLVMDLIYYFVTRTLLKRRINLA